MVNRVVAAGKFERPTVWLNGGLPRGPTHETGNVFSAFSVLPPLTLLLIGSAVLIFYSNFDMCYTNSKKEVSMSFW